MSTRRRTRTKSRVIGLSVAVTTVAAAVATFSVANADEETAPAAAGADHAVFVQGNEVSGNTIHAFKRSDNGELTAAGTYKTGGKGAVATGAPTDALASQGSLVYDARHQMLIGVNAGSGSVTSFSVSGQKLSDRHSVSSGGDFPLSVAVYGDTAYVLNGGGEASVQGFAITEKGLKPMPGSKRSLGVKGPAVPVFSDNPAQVSFTPDGKNLAVTIKSTNSIEVFPVGSDGSLARKAVSNKSEGNVPFGFTFDQGGRMVVTEAEKSTVSSYDVGSDGKLATVSAAVPNGQNTLCWIQAAGGFFYGASTGNSAVSAYRVDSDGKVEVVAKQAVPLSADSRGAIDMAASADGAFLYVQNGTTGNIDGFRVEANGKLTLVTKATDGLPRFSAETGGMEGIVAA
ncbi:lactonase family protein [Streptomyces asiaticus]|uniref:lactonase family protein n=1 Tax=Streptomyces asiaticus TaxID=114695 RepID=UPI003D7110D0